MSATTAVGRIGPRINDDAITNHRSLSAQALVILANHAISTWGTRLAMFRRVDLHDLCATKRRAFGNHTFPRDTRRAITASMVAFPTVFEITLCIVSGTVAVGISKTPAVNAIKTINTEIVAGTTIVDVCVDIGQDTIADLQATNASDAIASFSTNGSVRTAMLRGVFFTSTVIFMIACVASKRADTVRTGICDIRDITLRAMRTAVRSTVCFTHTAISVIVGITSKRARAIRTGIRGIRDITLRAMRTAVCRAVGLTRTAILVIAGITSKRARIIHTVIRGIRDIALRAMVTTVSNGVDFTKIIIKVITGITTIRARAVYTCTGAIRNIALRAMCTAVY